MIASSYSLLEDVYRSFIEAFSPAASCKGKPVSATLKAALLDVADKMEKSLDSFKKELSKVRTGRASLAILDGIHVDAYGSSMSLNQVGSLTIPESRLIVIQPWDKAVLPEIEKAIQKSELSLNPNNDGKVIRINIPPLTEERRKEFVKLAKNMAEQCRVAIRNVRRDANEDLKKKQKDGSLTEDDFKKGTDDIQKMTDDFIKEVNDILEAKEKEIMEV